MIKIHASISAFLLEKTIYILFLLVSGIISWIFTFLLATYRDRFWKEYRKDDMCLSIIIKNQILGIMLVGIMILSEKLVSATWSMLPDLTFFFQNDLWLDDMLSLEWFLWRVWRFTLLVRGVGCEMPVVLSLWTPPPSIKDSSGS